MSQPKSETSETIVHHLTPARPGDHCWCGKEAIVHRTGAGVDTSYCAKHWDLWWMLAMSGAPDIAM